MGSPTAGVSTIKSQPFESHNSPLLGAGAKRKDRKNPDYRLQSPVPWQKLGVWCRGHVAQQQASAAALVRFTLAVDSGTECAVVSQSRDVSAGGGASWNQQRKGLSTCSSVTYMFAQQGHQGITLNRPDS